MYTLSKFFRKKSDAKPEMKPDKADKPRTRWFSIPLFLLALGGYFYFGLQHLGKFQTADEDLWYANPKEGRIHEYWHAVENKSWEDTRINDKPGVTTALLGYFGYKHDAFPESKMMSNGRIVDTYNPKVYEDTAYHYQLPFVIANGILLLLLFFLAWKYTESDIFALTFAGLTALTPVLIGISQIVNPDATVWSFGITTLFAYLVFLKTAHFRWLLLAAPLFGLALLSKYGTAFLIFFTFFATFAHLFFNIETFADRKKYANTTIKLLIGWVLFIAGTIGVFVLLMPAAYYKPEYIYEGTIGFKHAKDVSGLFWIMGSAFGLFLLDAIFLRGRAMFLVLNKIRLLRQPILVIFALVFSGVALFTLFNWGWHNHFNFADVPYDTGNGKEFTKLDLKWKPFLEMKPLVFTTQPAALIPAFLTLLLFIWKRNRYTFLLFSLTTLIIFYYAAVISQNVLVHSRYSVLVYPPLVGIAAIGIAITLEKLLKNRRLRQYGIVLLFFAASVSSIRFIQPYYFLYTNDFLPKKQIITSAWGIGGYEAAQWINAQPNAFSLITWSDYEGVCPFLKGRCIKGSVIKWYKGKNKFVGFDYVVITRKGYLKNGSSFRALQEQDKIYPDPVWEMYIGGREGDYVKIYKMREEYSSFQNF